MFFLEFMLYIMQTCSKTWDIQDFHSGLSLFDCWYYLSHFWYDLLLNRYMYLQFEDKLWKNLKSCNYWMISITEIKKTSFYSLIFQPAVTCSKATIETMEKCVKLIIKLTMNAPESRHWRQSLSSTVNIEQI